MRWLFLEQLANTIPRHTAAQSQHEVDARLLRAAAAGEDSPAIMKPACTTGIPIRSTDTAALHS